MKRRKALRRRRLVALGAVAALIGVFDHALKELTLPLRHEDVIRQQAEEKGVDAALIAAVIYSESKFSDQTSSAGARGLMQITPEAAEFIEKQSGGTGELQHGNLISVGSGGVQAGDWPREAWRDLNGGQAAGSGASSFSSPLRKLSGLTPSQTSTGAEM